MGQDSNLRWGFPFRLTVGRLLPTRLPITWRTRRVSIPLLFRGQRSASPVGFACMVFAGHWKTRRKPGVPIRGRTGISSFVDSRLVHWSIGTKWQRSRFQLELLGSEPRLTAARDSNEATANCGGRWNSNPRKLIHSQSPVPSRVRPHLVPEGALASPYPAFQTGATLFQLFRRSASWLRRRESNPS